MKRALKESIAIILNKLGLLPRKFHSKVEQLSTIKKLNRKIWGKVQLNWNQDGYWVVNPMPTDEQLDDYYANIYWESRGGKKCLVSPRDLDHYFEIKQMYPEKVFSKVLNFGAGHGGLSILFHMAGTKVTNVEPSPLELGFDWKNVKTIEEAEETYDLIYGSHSLEHVTDVHQFFSHAEKILSSSGVFYFEVPNCHPNNPKHYPAPELKIPHTYYFTRDFFAKLPYQIKLNSTYKSINKTKYTKLNDDTGNVIRFSAVKN
jgi:SAM-dependent methyltransferase